MMSSISLAGEWSCRLDSNRLGLGECWHNWADEQHRVTLPGTTQTNGIGPTSSVKRIDNLTPNTEHVGPAWYWRDVELSEDDCQQHLELSLERVCWESFAWLNGEILGTCDSLVSPHVYEIGSAAKPGTNRLCVMVDNSNLKNSSRDGIAKMAEAEELIIEANAERRLNCGGHHASFGGFSWNGITGGIQLRVCPRVRIRAVRAYPDVSKKQVTVKCALINDTETPAEAKLAFHIDGQLVQQDIAIPPGRHQESAAIDLGQGLRPWDDHSPELYDLCVSLESEHGVDKQDTQFGMRSLSSIDNQFAINGRKVFLRGALEKFVHPITGYPPTDVDYWLKIFQVHKDHGLNHLRFHSCCPPEAGFVAADRLGIILNVELPGSSGGETRDDLTQNYLRDEALRILDEFGNHPSFCMLTMGNEVLDNEIDQADGMARLMKRVALCRENDSRHWYCCSAHAYTPGREDDFYVTAWPNGATARERHNGEPLRGFRWNGGDVVDDSRFNTRAPETCSDYRDGIAGMPRPVITHEVGMWAVYPNISEIPRYDGVMKPYNLEIIRDFMQEKGTIGQARDFVKASGMLSLLLYKEEIEAALRTPGLSGFQLLGIHDHPPQGTSTVGIVTALREPKGLIEGEDFRQFCSDTVPLARLPKRTYTMDESLETEVEVSHYGATDLRGAVVGWRLSAEDGGRTVEGVFDSKDLPSGSLTGVGRIVAALTEFSAPSKLRLSVFLEGHACNSWDCWVYPSEAVGTPEGVTWAREWSLDLAKAVESGRTVILELGREQIPHATRGCFTTLLWNPIMKRKHHSQTMGILCDPEHPALAEFPTEFHTNWQWWDVMRPSSVLDLDELDPRPVPIVRMVDSFIGNRCLSPLFEARMGEGRLIVTSLDLSTDLEGRHAARQLRSSLLAYAASDKLDPRVVIAPGDIDALIAKHRVQPVVPSRAEVVAQFEKPLT